MFVKSVISKHVKLPFIQLTFQSDQLKNKNVKIVKLKPYLCQPYSLRHQNRARQHSQAANQVI